MVTRSCHRATYCFATSQAMIFFNCALLVLFFFALVWCRGAPLTSQEYQNHQSKMQLQTRTTASRKETTCSASSSTARYKPRRSPKLPYSLTKSGSRERKSLGSSAASSHIAQNAKSLFSLSTANVTEVEDVTSQ